MNKKVLIWINCYGAWAPELRSPIETTGYSEYLDEVTSKIIALGDKIEAIYVSGGMKDKLGRTECQTTIPEIQRRIKKKNDRDVEIRSDEQSLTSITIVKKFLTTWKDLFSNCSPILFTDQVRYQTNKYALEYLANKYNLKLPPLEEVIIPIRRLDDHPNSTPEKQAEKLKYMQEKGVEETEKLEIEIRKKQLK